MTQGRHRDKRNHICGETFCKNCQQYYIDDHKCCMCSTVIDEVADMKEEEGEVWNCQVMTLATHLGGSISYFTIL